MTVNFLCPGHLPPEVPQILINREPLRQMTFDVELLGDCDVIVAELCQRLGGSWRDLLEEFDVPCGVEKKSLFAEEPTLGAGIGDPKESNRPHIQQVLYFSFLFYFGPVESLIFLSCSS